MDEGNDSLTAERIEELLADGALERLGMGSRRTCYALPGGVLCVKCYRTDAEIAEGRHPERPPFSPVTERVAREIRRNRFDEARNSCCQECRYWHEMMERLPEELMSVFPSTMRMLRLPSRGWCVVEERVMNADALAVAKPAENAPLRLSRSGTVLATGRLGTVGAQRAFVVDAVTA